MEHDARQIVRILDDCAEKFSFPMLDNGYVYLAATRLSLFRSDSDWAMVFEVFGHSPRSGAPDLMVQTIASRLHDRDKSSRYRTEDAYRRYLEANPHNDSRFFFPVDGKLQEDEYDEHVSPKASAVVVRGVALPLPPLAAYADHGVEVEQSPRIQVFELCRVLAATHRELVLASAAERRVSVLPDMRAVLTLDAWRHPDLAGGEMPSSLVTFQSLTQVLATGDASAYTPEEPNTHWRHWPAGGRQ